MIVAPSRVLRGRHLACPRRPAPHRLRRQSEGRHRLGDRHGRLQRQAPVCLRDAAAADDPHRRGPRGDRPQPTYPDALHRQPGNQRRLGDRRLALQRHEHERLPGGAASRPALRARRAGRRPGRLNRLCRHRYEHPVDDRQPEMQCLPPRWLHADAADGQCWRFQGGSPSTRRPTRSMSRNSGRSVSVFDAETCNATTTSGCENVQTLQVPGGNAVSVAVDAATNTVYVTTVPASGPTPCRSSTGRLATQLTALDAHRCRIR